MTSDQSLLFSPDLIPHHFQQASSRLSRASSQPLPARPATPSRLVPTITATRGRAPPCVAWGGGPTQIDSDPGGLSGEHTVTDSAAGLTSRHSSSSPHCTSGHPSGHHKSPAAVVGKGVGSNEGMDSGTQRPVVSAFPEDGDGRAEATGARSVSRSCVVMCACCIPEWGRVMVCVVLLWCVWPPLQLHMYVYVGMELGRCACACDGN